MVRGRNSSHRNRNGKNECRPRRCCKNTAGRDEFLLHVSVGMRARPPPSRKRDGPPVDTSVAADDDGLGAAVCRARVRVAGPVAMTMTGTVSSRFLVVLMAYAEKRGRSCVQDERNTVAVVV